MKINEKVTVGIVNNTPRYVKRSNKIHTVDKIGLHHTYREGKTLHHIFSVICGSTFMRLNYNTDTLSWILEDIENGI